MAPSSSIGRDLRREFQKALKAIGPRAWWPGETDLEVMVGAILTQNTAWKNVEKAILALKDADALTLPALLQISEEDLAPLIRSSGYFRMKARKLKALAEFLRPHAPDDYSALRKMGLGKARELLLGVHGVGPETADSILLYALSKPTFVVDAYTRRIFSRHGLFPSDVSYEEMRSTFMRELPSDVALYNEFHALIVYVGNQYCRNQKPRCEECPWNWMKFGQIPGAPTSPEELRKSLRQSLAAKRRQAKSRAGSTSKKDRRKVGTHRR